MWRVTAKKRMVAKLLAIKAELGRRRHEPKALVGEWLQKVTTAIMLYRVTYLSWRSSGVGYADCGGTC